MCVMWLYTVLLLTSVGILSVHCNCEYKSKGKTYDVQEGEVTQVKKTTVRVCTNGKLILKKNEEVPKPYKFACGGEEEIGSIPY